MKRENNNPKKKSSDSPNTFDQSELEFLNLSEELNPTFEENEDGFQSLFTTLLTGIKVHDKLRARLKRVYKDSESSDKNIPKEIFGVLIRELIQKIDKSSQTINKIFLGTYSFCEENDKFWHNCSLRLYQKYFPRFRNNYLKKFNNADELDFLRYEINHFFTADKSDSSLNHLSIEGNDPLSKIDYEKYLSYENREFFNLQNQHKLDFLTGEARKLGYFVQLAKRKKKVFINLTPLDEVNSDLLEEQVLEKSSLPEFNLLERFELLRRLGFEDDLIKTNSTKKVKNLILAITMDCSLDNARKLQDRTYKMKGKLENKERNKIVYETIDEFLKYNNINTKP